MSRPAISVVMPVYNGQDYVLDAVASIAEQSFRDWELLCVNDGSSDRTAEILDWFASQDPRVRVIHQQNTGLVGALNHGFDQARAELVMRMDHDDLALPDRMQRQYRFMQQNSDCVVCGGAIMEMDSDGDLLGSSSLPLEHDNIVADLLHRRTGHFHPTTLIRANAFQRTGGYRDEFKHIEDHDLWLRMSKLGRLVNLPDVVLCYRLHAASVCWTQADFRRERMNALMEQAYAELDREIPEGVLVDTTVKRQPAGPGKWARAAARRARHTTAWKHCRQLWGSDAAMSYKLRMTAEVAIRIAAGYVKANSDENQLEEAPQFPEWHRRFAEANIRAAAA